MPNLRKGWQVLLNAANSESGRKLIEDAMRLCPHSRVDSKSDGILLAQWLQNAWDYLAMVGSFVSHVEAGRTICTRSARLTVTVTVFVTFAGRLSVPFEIFT